MTPKRVSFGIMGLVFLLFIAVFATTVAGDYLFKKQSGKITELKAQNQAIKDQQVSLAQAKADIAKYDELDQISKAIVPQDKDQAKTIREINAIASNTGIKLQQISFDASSLGLASPGSSSSSTSSSSLTQVKPVTGISGVYTLEITISTGEADAVSYYQFLKFLENLESNRRTAHVTSINVTPSIKNPSNVTFSLTLNAYLKP